MVNYLTNLPKNLSEVTNDVLIQLFAVGYEREDCVYKKYTVRYASHHELSYSDELATAKLRTVIIRSTILLY